MTTPGTGRCSSIGRGAAFDRFVRDTEATWLTLERTEMSLELISRATKIARLEHLELLRVLRRVNLEGTNVDPAKLAPLAGPAPAERE